MRIPHALLLTLAALPAVGCRAWTPGGVPPDTAVAPAVDLTDAQKTDVRLSLARSLEGRGEWDAAAEAYAATLAGHPEHAHALHRLAVVRVRQGRPDEADDLFRRALAANPGDADLFADLGYCDLLCGRDAAAERNLRQAIALRPGHAAAHGNLALLLASRGEPGEALAEFRAAGATGPAAHGDLAVTLATAGRPDAAREHLALAVALADGTDGADGADDPRLRELDAVLARVAPEPPGRAEILPAAAEVPAP